MPIWGTFEAAYPRTERIAETVISLPMGPHLGSDQQDYVISALQEFA